MARPEFHKTAARPAEKKSVPEQRTAPVRKCEPIPASSLRIKQKDSYQICECTPEFGRLCVDQAAGHSAR